MTTLDDLATQLAVMLDRNNEDEFPTSVRYWCVNRAVYEIVRMEQCPWGTFYTTVTWPAGTSSQPLTFFDQYAYRIEAMAYDMAVTSLGGSDTDARVVSLARLSPEDRLVYTRDTYPAATEEQLPEAFSQIGGLLFLLPPPNEQMTLKAVGRKNVAELALGTDHNEITDDTPEAVLWLAATRALPFFPGETGIESVIYQEARKMKTDLAVRYARAQDSHRLRDELKV